MEHNQKNSTTSGLVSAAAFGAALGATAVLFSDKHKRQKAIQAVKKVKAKATGLIHQLRGTVEDMAGEEITSRASRYGRNIARQLSH